MSRILEGRTNCKIFARAANIAKHLQGQEKLHDACNSRAGKTADPCKGRKKLKMFARARKFARSLKGQGDSNWC